jgi:hypothetical protein
VKWRPFRYCQDTYDLGHLHPKTITYVLEAKGNKPERTYTVEVIFSLHCFTRGFKDGEVPDPALCYSDHRETRVFDFQRYQLSQHLPAIVEGLSKRKCYHTGLSNFLTIEILNQADQTIVQYEVFFEVSRSSQKGRLNLFIQSAYVRSQSAQGNRRHHNKPIGFFVILHNTLNKIEIKAPK